MNDAYINAQAGVLGCLIIDSPRCAAEIFSCLKTEHFSVTGYAALFEGARELYFEGRPIDHITLGAKIPEYASLMLSIVEQTPTAANFREYAAAVKEEYVYDRVLRLSDELTVQAARRDTEGMRETSAAVIAALDGEGENDRPLGIADIFGDFLDEMDRKPEYISYGIKALDGRMYTEKGDYVVIGARPSVGKTAIALNFAYEMSEKYRTVFYSLETGESKLAARFFANVMDTDFGKIKSRSLSDSEKAELAMKYAPVAKRKIFFRNASGKTAFEICSAALRDRAEVVIIDYMGLIGGTARSEYERVSAISKEFHTFAQRHKVLVIMICQLSREGGRDRPTLAALRDSGQIEQDADAVLLLHKPLEDDPLRELIIAKNKEGITGSVALDFDGSRQRFFESERAGMVLRKSREGKKGSDVVARVLGNDWTKGSRATKAENEEMARQLKMEGRI